MRSKEKLEYSPGPQKDWIPISFIEYLSRVAVIAFLSKVFCKLRSHCVTQVGNSMPIMMVWALTWNRFVSWGREWSREKDLVETASWPGMPFFLGSQADTASLASYSTKKEKKPNKTLRRGWLLKWINVFPTNEWEADEEAGMPLFSCFSHVLFLFSSQATEGRPVTKAFPSSCCCPQEIRTRISSEEVNQTREANLIPLKEHVSRLSLLSLNRLYLSSQSYQWLNDRTS